MADKKDANDGISEDELDQIIQDMSKDDEAEDAAPTPAPKPVLEVMQAKKAVAVAAPAPAPVAAAPASSSEQALTLEMNGVVNLKLCFKNGERSIEVLCTEESLICRMADGTEFKIPTGISKARKAA